MVAVLEGGGLYGDVSILDGVRFIQKGRIISQFVLRVGYDIALRIFDHRACTSRW
jgi:hypothetical protein